jgi:hypothetical protein
MSVVGPFVKHDNNKFFSFTFFFFFCPQLSVCIDATAASAAAAKYRCCCCRRGSRGPFIIIHAHIYVYCIYCYVCMYRFHDEDTTADGTRDVITTADRARGLNICPSTHNTHATIAHTVHGPLNNHVTLYIHRRIG